MLGISTMRHRATAGSLLLLCSLVPATAEEQAGFALGTAFTYQGRLQQAGAPAEGRFDLSFELLDGAQGGRSLGCR